MVSFKRGYRITNISKAGWQKFAISDLGWDISGAGSNRRSKYSLISYDAIGLRYDSCFMFYLSLGSAHGPLTKVCAYVVI